ncbi:LytTR family DNA-binding domain-containing protein [Sphingomonas sp. HF-S4]|uniref:LytTR family DNA-binding domain-containing protein n=1 Tax=Sphingomonas agrestis TaxID=3080540 RepID=A0ABU3YB92_9SPHN|nr:LytTR family DNA-binding domain-containing protein [Sphingomonas sp. HF-S4]MDV3458641.1 LytTR family DNA-binding domain-containing protein [Sphingomonas sp. HF-S4]
MPAARTARQSRADPAPGKPRFANRVLGFAKRTWRDPPPGFPLLWIGSLGAAGLMVVTGGFGTGRLMLGHRIGFWLLLMGVNALKWQLWFAWRVRKPGDWPRASLLGTPLLNLTLPVEIALCGAAVGQPFALNLFETWGHALAISAMIIAVAAMAAWVVLHRPQPAAAPIPDGGLLGRARVTPDALAAVEAEDHYCRVHSRDGRSTLIHYRFGDALVELAGIDGAQVHRGAWVAGEAVQGVERDGRRWLLQLAGGAAVPVSATYAAEARRRGWLRRR